jgi:hypothetical protein
MGVIAITLIMMSSPSFAREFSLERVRLRTEADLSVTAIFAYGCKCDLSDVDILYMGGISVDIGKRDISTPEAIRREPSAVVGILTVTYHDFLAGRLVTRTLSPQNHHFTGGVGTVEIISRPVVIKKSVGIRAEFRLNTPGYADVDPNSGNNVMTKYTCEIMVR